MSKTYSNYNKSYIAVQLEVRNNKNYDQDYLYNSKSLKFICLYFSVTICSSIPVCLFVCLFMANLFFSLLIPNRVCHSYNVIASNFCLMYPPLTVTHQKNGTALYASCCVPLKFSVHKNKIISNPIRKSVPK